MKAHLLLAVFLASGGWLLAQERKIPKDSTRVSVTGCSRGRSLISTTRSEAEPVGDSAEPGRRFRLSGPKKMLAEIRAEEGHLIEVTGLVKTSQLSPATMGVPIAGGRIRIGGGPPNRDPTMADPRRDPLLNEPVMDVESWRPLPDSCPNRDK